MIKFFKSHDPDNPHDIADVLFQIPNDAPLDEAIETFEAFLRAAGYVFAGHLELVEDGDE